MVNLKYIGDGAYIPGVPACDLTQEMIDECGVPLDDILASNLYEHVTDASAKAAPVDVTPKG